MIIKETNYVDLECMHYHTIFYIDNVYNFGSLIVVLVMGVFFRTLLQFVTVFIIGCIFLFISCYKKCFQTVIALPAKDMLNLVNINYS
jgi:hypothetical protein